jgi:hypothetical protein
VVRRVAERDLQRTPLAFVALAALAIALLLMLRADALGGLGGYGRPSPEAAMRNILRGLDGVYRLVPTDRPWQGVASGFATALPIVALVAWPWISRGARLCLVAGFAIAFLFNLPALFVTKPEQVYFVGLGASLTLTGAVVAMLDLAARTRAPAACDLVLVAVLSVGLAAFVALTRDITRDFEPFGPNVLSNDDIVRTWWTVPTEVHDYLARKREVGAANRMSSNPALELPHAIFGVHGRETSPDGVAYVWMAGARVEIHTSATARLLAIPLRHERGAFREDARVLIDVDGRPADDLLLDSGDWRVSTLSLRPQDVSSSRRMHRIRIAIDHAWQPSTIIPGSTDERVLGLQIGGLSVR